MTPQESGAGRRIGGSGFLSPEISLYANSIMRAREYLLVTQAALRNGYRWENSGAKADCAGIARTLAGILLPIHPSLLHVGGEPIDRYSSKSLIPKCYNGVDNGFGQPVSWGNHIVCAVKDTIFDPIVGKPMDAHLYQTTVFKTPAVLTTKVPADEMVEYLKDPLLWDTRRPRR